MGIKELTWVAERPSDSTSQFIAGRGVGRSKNEHKKVRRHAAHISATARLATVRRRNHEIIVKLVQQQYLATRRRRPNLQSGEDDPPPWFITKLLAESSWYQTAVQMNSLGQKSERNILWGALTHNTSLLQVALLAAGTNTNACGLAPGQLTHMGLGLVHLKSASLQSIQSAIEHSVRDSLTAVAIALLAAWERGTRHGEESAYQMHMSAWRCMKCPPTREEERTVDTLMHAVMQLFNEQLDEISAVAASSPSSSRARYPASLPIGFRIFSLSRPETRSLLGIVSRVARTDPTVSSSLPAVRELCIQAIGWSASHSVSVALEVCPLHEAEWDFYELQALYHIRAALISLNGILHVVTSRTHRVHWTMDHRSALLAHTISCRHLATEALMDTQYAAIAFWSRFMMCSISRDPNADSLLHRWMRMLKVDTWSDLESLLHNFVDFKPYLGKRLHQLYMIITGKAKDTKLDGWEDDEW